MIDRLRTGCSAPAPQSVTGPESFARRTGTLLIGTRPSESVSLRETLDAEPVDRHVRMACRNNLSHHSPRAWGELVGSLAPVPPSPPPRQDGSTKSCPKLTGNPHRVSARARQYQGLGVGVTPAPKADTVLGHAKTRGGGSVVARFVDGRQSPSAAMGSRPTRSSPCGVRTGAGTTGGGTGMIHVR